MGNFYTNERNVQIVLFLLKANGIKKVVASPGATNITVVASMQNDSFFEMYSAADERSAAYNCLWIGGRIWGTGCFIMYWCYCLSKLYAWIDGSILQKIAFNSNNFL